MLGMDHAYVVFAVVILALVGFLWGRWRYDFVAIGALLTLTIWGIVPTSGENGAFSGFGHPAVITVAAVMVISRGLTNAGVVDFLATLLGRVGNRLPVQIAALTGVVMIASAFMNNVGALALLLPVAIRLAKNAGHPPGLLLMPLAFGSLLGGTMTMIGTPANLIIATYRGTQEYADYVSYSVFDYLPTGLAICASSVLFISLIGWRLVPRRVPAGEKGLFQVGEYLTEARIPKGSALSGHTIADVRALSESGVLVVAVVRSDRRITAPSPYFALQHGDVLVLEGDAEAIRQAVAAAKFELVGSKNLGRKDISSEETTVAEVIVSPSSIILGRSAVGLNLRRHHGVNLLAVSRHGRRLKRRLAEIRFRAGDVMLIQASSHTLSDTLTALGLLPLADRGVSLPRPKKLLAGLGLFGGALALSAFGVMPAELAFVLCAALMHILRLLPLHQAYRSIDLPVVVLLAAMIPVGVALETTGGAAMIANTLVEVSGGLHPLITCALLFIVTSTITDIVNNAAAALLMAPIAVLVAVGLEINPDVLLMTVAVASSASFLTPVGHQSNLLVMGPGGFRFGDYWRMGLPLTLVVGGAAIPTIWWWWGG